MSRRRARCPALYFTPGPDLARRRQQLLLDVVADGSWRDVGPFGQIVQVVIERLDGLHASNIALARYTVKTIAEAVKVVYFGYMQSLTGYFGDEITCTLQ